jgi:hypothetical protein
VLHGEDVTGAEDVDAWVRYALLPPVVDKLGTKEHDELARGLFLSVEAAFEITSLKVPSEKPRGWRMYTSSLMGA